MSDGIFINGLRPKSKKAVKEAIATAPETVLVESTSMFSASGNMHLASLAMGKRYDFVGPDPYTSRKFYGTIVRTGENSWKVS